MQMKGKWALITGASSGLGADFAYLLAERRANLVLVGLNAHIMETLAKDLCEKFDIVTHVIAMDLSKAGIGAKLKSQLDVKQIQVDLLINNAGYGLYGDFIRRPLSVTLNMLQLNILGLTELTHVFANDMARRGQGKILLVASVIAFQAAPLYAVYGASKAYVLLLGEALHEELKSKGVTVTVLTPGVTATRFYDVSGQNFTFYHRLMVMQSRPVAKIGLNALEAGKACVVAGWLNMLATWLVRFIPRFLQRKIAYLFMKN